ncbi:hypothetical protein BH09ACT6_BH09ACT6_27400 [soil metagenome]
MMFLAVLGVIGLVAIAGCIYAIATDGYGRVPTRGAEYYRTRFHRGGFGSGSGATGGATPTSSATPTSQENE